MPRLIFTVSEEERELWVERAYDERISLAEWLRRAANARAGNGAGGLEAGQSGRSETGGLPGGGATSSASPPASSPPVFSPDWSEVEAVRPRKVGPDEMVASAGLPPAEPSPPPKTARKRSAPRVAMCDHRVPAGSYCRKCDS